MKGGGDVINRSIISRDWSKAVINHLKGERFGKVYVRRTLEPGSSGFQVVEPDT